MITGMLHSAVETNPSKIALVCGQQRIPYDELARGVASFAAGLSSLGIKEGDCVAAVLRNCPEFVIGFLASTSLRAIFLPLNPQYTRSEIYRFIADAPARVIIAGASSLTTCQAAVGSMEPAVPIVVVGEQRPGAISFHDLTGNGKLSLNGKSADARALYLYSSGSTDTYKRVCCTQENLYFEARNFVETMQLTSEDAILCTIPLFHSYGIGNCLLDALYLGTTLVMLEQNPATGQGEDGPFINQCGQLARLVQQEGIRFYPGVPYQFAVLAGLPESFPIDFNSVRLCVSSGDFLPRRTYERFLTRFGQPIRSLYGSTEAGSIAINSAPRDRLEFGTVGKPLCNVVIQVRGADGQVLNSGQKGEIWVKSPTLPPKGYDNRPELTEEVFRDGFYRTGDFGLVDREGQLTLTGRKQSFVDIAGYKVDLGEVEEALLECPGVQEAATLGVNIPNVGTLIKAVIVARPGWGEHEIQTFCRERMAFVKVPRLIELRDALPRSSTGKVLKSELADVTPFLDQICDITTQKLIEQLKRSFPERRGRLLTSLVQWQTAAVLGRPVEEVPIDSGFAQLGLDSFASIELRVRLEYLLERELPETLTFDHPTAGAVAQYLQKPSR